MLEVRGMGVVKRGRAIVEIRATVLHEVGVMIGGKQLLLCLMMFESWLRGGRRPGRATCSQVAMRRRLLAFLQPVVKIDDVTLMSRFASM